MNLPCWEEKYLAPKYFPEMKGASRGAVKLGVAAAEGAA
jgi:hypothetical protein